MASSSGFSSFIKSRTIKKGDEHTAVRFNIGADGSVSNINSLQKKLVVIGAA